MCDAPRASRAEAACWAEDPSVACFERCLPVCATLRQFEVLSRTSKGNDVPLGGILLGMRSRLWLVLLGAVAACSVNSLDELAGGAAGAPSGGSAGDSGAALDAGPEGGLVCGAETKQCGNECVPKNSVAHGCGAASCQPCSLPHAQQTNCHAEGECAVASCEPGWGDCTAEPGCETQVNTVAHCGSCDNACGQNQVCATGQCATSCPSGTTNCSGACVELAADSQNCGTCGNGCPSAPNGVGVCVNGQCDIQCNPAYTRCGASCIDTKSNTSHCGGCGNKCALANANATCSDGSCVLVSCSLGWGNCDANSANGCEASLSSTMHCGACNSACQAGVNASATCTSGKCGVLCNPGFGNCDASKLGCETNLASDPSNCGTCGTVCPCVCSGGVCSGGKAC